MLDVVAYGTKMKLTWFKRVVCNEGKCYKIIEKIFDIGTLMNTGTSYVEKIIRELNNQFWIVVLKYYISLVEKMKMKTSEHMLTTPLFYNDHIKIGHESFFL